MKDNMENKLDEKMYDTMKENIGNTVVAKMFFFYWIPNDGLNQNQLQDKIEYKMEDTAMEKNTFCEISSSSQSASAASVMELSLLLPVVHDTD